MHHSGGFLRLKHYYEGAMNMGKRTSETKENLTVTETKDMKDFTEQVRTILSERYPECELETRNVIKNNGMVYHGVMIKKQNSNISPTIYLDDFFEKHRAGMRVEDVANIIAEVYEANKCPESSEFDFVTDYEKAGKYICFKLINTEKNREMLSDVPNIPLCDLSVVFYILFDQSDGNGSSSLLIRQDLMEQWGVGVEELYRAASENVGRMLPSFVRPITEVVREMAHTAGMEPFDIPDLGEEKVFVASNIRKTFGAGVILYDGLLQSLADDLDDDLYIVPSSVHEVIFMPRYKVEDKDTLRRMVNEVNTTMVRPEEVLSDNLYLYDRNKHEISVA